ncbi:hypothetical protein KAX29_00705, partial [candidate division WOR-3 bacterium]|nr:hypothetical protein [candidate division WOR-3 bacterium]
MWIAKSATSEYAKSWKKGKFAKRLSLFIDKVLSATGAPKVDIVTYSMGGLVARTAIKNYGCASKVRKLLMVGTPNHPYDRWWEDLYQAFGPDKSWQKMGENLEMGLSYYGGKTAYFLNLQILNSKFWCEWLGYNNLIDEMATIAGDKGKDYFGSVDNDGVVAVDQVHLNPVQFNPIIFASHCYENWLETALTTSTYTTEFIKKWIIDDEILPSGQVASNHYVFPSPYDEYELNADFYSVNNILSTVVEFISQPGNIKKYEKGIAWSSMGNCQYPVLCTDAYDEIGYHGVLKSHAIHQDMITGDINDNENIFGLPASNNTSAYVHFNIPYLSFIAGDKIQITNIDLGANHPDDTTYYYRWKNQSYQECDLDGSGRWVVPRPSSPENDTIILKCVVELDPVTYLKCWKRTRVRPRAAPVNVTLNYNGKSVKISWDEMSENDYYEIWRAVLVKGEEKGWGMVGTSPSSPFYDYTLPEGNHTYRYYVRGNFTYFSVDAPEISIYHLNPPTDLKAEIAGNVVELTWDDNSNINAGYEIKRRDIAGNENNWSVGDVESEIDDGVDPNHPAYIYWVRAFDNEGYTSSWAGPVTAKFDETPPNVNITTPGQYRVVYQGLFTVRWNVSDDFGYGVSSQKLYYPYHHSVNLEGDVRSREVNLQTTGRGSEEEIILKATDYAFNTGEDANTVVIIDPNQTNYPLWLSHDDNWYITITTEHGKVAQRLFNRVYKGKGNNWSRINISKRNCWRDPNPLNEGQTRNYLVCLNDFDSLSDIKTVTRPANPHPCPVLYSFTGDSYEQDNSLLPASEFTHQLTRDYYILKKNPKEIDGAYKFEIIEGVDNTYIDLIKLRVIDHPKEVKIGALPNGEVIPIKPSILPFKAIDKKGKDWKDSLLTEGRGYYYGKKGDYLDAYFREKG